MAMVNDVAGQDDGQQVTKTSIDVFDSLPEILAMIFDHLSTADKGMAAQVCVAWRKAAMVKYLWKDVKAKIRCYEPVDKHLIAALAERSVTKIMVTFLGGNHLFDVVDGVGSLKELDLLVCVDATDANLASSFAKERPNLVSLAINGFYSVTDASIALVAKSVRNLHTLRLHFCGELTDHSFLLIAEHLKSLTSLYLNHSFSVTDTAIGHLCGVDSHQAGVPLQLKSLLIIECSQLTDEAMLHLGMRQKSLEWLTLRPTRHMTDDTMTHLSRLAGLKSLVLSWVDDIWLSRLVTENFNVVCLELDTCDAISDDGLRYLTELRNLEELTIERGPSFNDDSLMILVGCSKLRKLTVINCKQVTDDCPLHLPKYSNLQFTVIKPQIFHEVNLQEKHNGEQ